MEKNNLDETIGSGSVITSKDVLNEHLLQNDENNNENSKTSTLNANEQSSSYVDTSSEHNFGQSPWNCHTMGPAHKINQKSEMLLVSCNISQYQQEKKKEDGKEKNRCSENSKRNIDEVLEHNSTVLCDVCPNLIPNSLVKQEDVSQDCMHRHKDDQMETNGIDLEVRCLMDAIKKEIKVEELKHDVTSDVNFSIENHGIETSDVLRNLNSSFSEYTYEDKQNNDMIADKTKQTNQNKGNCIKKNSQIFQLSKIPKLENSGQFDEFEWEDSKLEYSCILYNSDTQHYDCSEGTRNEKSNIHSPDNGLGNTFLAHEHLKYGIEVCEKCVNTKCQNVEINSCLQDDFDLKYETQSDDLNSEEASFEKATINVEDNISTSINKTENCVDCKFESIQPEFSEKKLALNMPVRCPDKALSKDSDTGEAKWHSAMNIANYQDKTPINIVDNLIKTNEQFPCKSPNFQQEHYEMTANENLNQVCPKNDDLNNQKYENETHVHTGTWRNFETGKVECYAVSIETDGYQVDVPGFDKPDTKEELAIKHCNKVNPPLVYTTNSQNISCLLGNKTEQIHNVDDPKHNTSSDLEFSGDSELLYQAMCASGIFDTTAECLKLDSDFERNITFDNCSVEQPLAYVDAKTQLVDTDDAGVCMAAEILECNESLVVFEECCNNLFPLADLNKVSLPVDEGVYHGANNNLGYLQSDVSVIDKESEIISPWQTLESGSGQIYQYNPILLQLESLTTGRLSSDGKFGCSEMMKDFGEKSITASSILNNEDENADNTNDCKPAQFDARVPERLMVKLPEDRLDRQACLYNMQDGGFGRNPHVIKVLPDGTVVDISQWFQCFMPEKCSYKAVSKKSKSNGTFKRKSLEKT